MPQLGFKNTAPSAFRDDIFKQLVFVFQLNHQSKAQSCSISNDRKQSKATKLNIQEAESSCFISDAV